jgi:hypothetical protein
VLNRIALAWPFFRMDRLTTLTRDPLGELGQGHAPVGEELVEVDDNGVAIAIRRCARHYTVPSRSARMPAPIRMTRAKMTRPRPNQKTGHDTDQATDQWARDLPGHPGPPRHRLPQ